MQIPITGELLKKVLDGATPESVLVGGQALAFWLSHYELTAFAENGVGAITDDADFLGTREDVTSIARNVDGVAEFPDKRAITALVGMVKIPVADGFTNVDVIHRVVGISSLNVKRRASEVTQDDIEFCVMHPLDVLTSKVTNLATLASKQNEQGVFQAKLAINVARAYIIDAANDTEEPRRVLKAINRVVKLAKRSPGRRVTKDYGISFIEAIPKEVVVFENFHKIRWERLVTEIR
ncbi:hypothetical protein [Burkholderia cepacia]|uniref:hypothetical protein n=1 Tax=Burkholderia cepacia TaxID=292 RepID=UPI000756F355|nr:hypothetical protein [Burkholderia cepacia]KVL12382.1 hypothetical protein WJ46_28660 [Burkholderia cepacia]KVQ29029.1 hypothetical protein WK02_21180 [Burkholderia cepacia]KVZ22374.1 hypothetical protein WL14_21075 [Burkholderia cepacia]